MTFAARRRFLPNYVRHPKGGIADYSGISYEKIERQQGVFWPCPTEDHSGTPRLFEPGSWNPVAQGKGPFYFPDGKARFNLSVYAPPAEDVDEDIPHHFDDGPGGQPVSLRHPDPAHRAAG